MRGVRFRVSKRSRQPPTLSPKSAASKCSTVETVVQHYFDAVYEGDADKLGAINAELYSMPANLTRPNLVPKACSICAAEPLAKTLRLH